MNCGQLRTTAKLSASVLAGLFVGVCGVTATADTETGECRLAPGEIEAVAVLWGGVTRNESCFYFSGPADIGRDDHLGSRAAWLRSGNLLSVSFEGVLFQGRIEGDRVELVRRSEHDFNGAWEVTERIDATLVGTRKCIVLEGAYTYAECDTSMRDACPGPCKLSARMSLRAK